MKQPDAFEKAVAKEERAPMTSQEQAKALLEWWKTQVDHKLIVHADDETTLLNGLTKALDAARRDQLVSDIRSARALPVSRVLVRQLEAELAARDNPALVIRQPKNPMKRQATG